MTPSSPGTERNVRDELLRTFTLDSTTLATMFPFLSNSLMMPGGVLVGMRVGYINAFGGAKVGAVQPIFQVGDKYIEGNPFGKEIPLTVTVVARPGYAVGSINTRAGLLLDGFQIIFARYKSGLLDTKDSYKSDWIGDPRGGGSANVSGVGNIVVGIHGRSNGREINAIGLVVAE